MQIRLIRSADFSLLAVFVLIAGCNFETHRRSTVQMKTGDRTVSASTDKIASITFDNHNFVISFSSIKCVVEPERVLYDGRELAKIPSTATSIVIEFVDGKLTVIADGQTVRQASPP